MSLIVLPFDNLHPLHWVFAIAIPLLMIVLTVINRLLLSRIHQQTTQSIRQLTQKINKLENRSIDHTSTVRSLLKKEAPSAASQAFGQMEADCTELYQGRWIPDPQQSLPLSVWISPFERSILSNKPVSQFIGIGIIASLIELILMQVIPLQNPAFQWIFVLLPIGTALAVSLPSTASVHQAKAVLDEALDQFYTALGRRLPVFNHQTGVASLVDAYLTYDHQMQERLNEFTDVTRRLADSDMADGVRRSVEQILTETVGPSLHRATSSLGDLAVDLTTRQSEGMQDLAGQFADAVTSQIATHLTPVNRDIAQMSALMADVKNYIEVAMRAMDTTRAQTEAVQQTLHQSVDQLSQAHAIMQQDFETANSTVSDLSAASKLLTETYQQAEESMRTSLDQVSASFKTGADQLTELSRQATQSVEQAQLLVQNHTRLTDSQIETMQQQSGLFSEHIQTSIENMLGHMHDETDAVATHADAISKQLETLNQILDQTTQRFGDSSTAYVKQTLDQFDESLADITMRLTQTAQEIQDAVDALPAAIQRSVNFGS
ncbi:MAG: hypothetical protein GXY22_01140 [Clostridiaceae bacterium]|nr:hypothetical protein [Clostridiaceae bacterium]